jgi:hypothetical protein
MTAYMKPLIVTEDRPNIIPPLHAVRDMNVVLSGCGESSGKEGQYAAIKDGKDGKEGKDVEAPPVRQASEVSHPLA